MVDKVAAGVAVAADKVVQQVPVELVHPMAAIVAEEDHDRATHPH